MSVIVAASGYTSDEYQELKRLVIDLRGEFRDFLSDEVTVHICKRAGLNQHRTALVLTEQWLFDSHRKGQFIENKRRYRVPVLRGVRLALMSVSRRYIGMARRQGAVLTRLEESPDVVVTVAEYFDAAKLIFSGIVVTTEWLELCKKQWVAPSDFVPSQTKVNYQLSGCIFYVDLPDPEDEVFAKKLIIRGGGTYVNQKLDILTHVVTNKPQMHKTGETVSVDWLKKQFGAF